MKNKQKKVEVNHYRCDICKDKVISETNTEQGKCLNCQNRQNPKQKQTKQLCPICNKYFETSEYLNTYFSDDEHVRWLANMVTHYRHVHVTSWDKTWSSEYGNNYRRGWSARKDYDSMKHDVNERAKRQILKKCKNFMIEKGFVIEHVAKLQGTTKQTLDLYTKILGNTKIKENSIKNAA